MYIIILCTAGGSLRAVRVGGLNLISVFPETNT